MFRKTFEHLTQFVSKQQNMYLTKVSVLLSLFILIQQNKDEKYCNTIFLNENQNLPKLSIEYSEPNLYKLQLNFYNIFILVIILGLNFDIEFKFHDNPEKTTTLGRIPILWARPAGTGPGLYKKQMCWLNLQTSEILYFFFVFWNPLFYYWACRYLSSFLQ